ncbi:hypothetical protein JXD38_01055 [candidate division WOR-3 bacterium]|nr:hypothetical protein [candidate division WOR-3 bacterium]
MSWFDGMTLAIMALVAIVQTVRGIKAGGMGLPFFEAAGVVIAAVAATALSPGLAGSIHVRQSTVLLTLFIVFSVLAFIVAHGLFAATSLSFQSLDGVLSMLCGLVMAWVVGHMFLRIMIGSADSESVEAIANSPVAREILRFRTWHALLRLLFKAKAGPEIDPGLD